MPQEPTPARLYCNPKDHKAVRPETGLPPMREIVSNSGSSTEGLGKIIDFYTRPVDMGAESYLEDTPDLLRQIQGLNDAGPQDETTFLFTMDVNAMFPSIPTSRGPAVQRRALEKAGLGQSLVDWLTRGTEAVLKYNTFDYDDTLYTQEEGSGIGAPASCSYAGIFMEDVEVEGLRRFKEVMEQRQISERGEVKWWKRFRDDVMGLFRGTLEQFLELFNMISNVDPAIDFTYEVDEGRGINFLDMTITKSEEGLLETDLFRKANVKNQLLLPSSCHTRRTTTNSVK